MEVNENLQQQSVSIDTFVHDSTNTRLMVAIVEFSQKVEFVTDKYTRGNQVAMRLSGSPIDAKNIEIYFKQKDLKKILEFLIEDDTTKTPDRIRFNIDQSQPLR